jgi:hypothetical protein
MLHLQPLTLPQPYLTASISCKRILENTDHYLMEVKKIDVGEIYENYYWLKITKDQFDVSPLNLKAIDSSREVEERFFDEGYLKFSADQGIFIEKFNSGQHQYQILNNVEAENMFMPALQSYFAEYKHLMN